MIAKSILHKLLLARRLYELARENLRSTNDLSIAIGVNLLQDSVEAFLLSVAEHVNAQIQAKTAFEQYFDLIDAKISPAVLPFRTRLLALNKLRVNSKHYGLIPAQSEVSGLPVTVREFFDEVTKAVLGLQFSTVSLIDLLRDGDAKTCLNNAEKAFQGGDFEKCLIDCRKALFIRIESEYDIAPFEKDDANNLGLLLLGRKAPYHARDREYIKKHVHDPTDYIVLDHGELEMELMKSGMDSVSFWNVWRLTPEVYRSLKGAPWVTKRSFAKLEAEGIKERAEYVLDTTISLLVSADQRVAAIRWTESRRYVAILRKEEVPLYEKASTDSGVITATPKGLTMINVDFTVEGLDGGLFWHVSHYDGQVSLYGYLSADDVGD